VLAFAAGQHINVQNPEALSARGARG
jgi:hypothetical protein